MGIETATHDTATSTLLPFPAGRAPDVFREWHDLAARSPLRIAPELFALNLPLADAGEPLVAEARRDGRLFGMLPLLRTGRTLSALQSEHMPEFDLAGGADAVESLWNALVEDDGWDVLTLKNVPSSSPLATELPRLARADGCRTATRPGPRHLVVGLRDLDREVSAKLRANLRRCDRKLGGVTLERTTTFARRDFEEAIAIEAMAWKDAAGTSLAADPRVTHLYEALIRIFGRRGQMALSFVRAEGKRIAMLLSLEDGRSVDALKIGYDPRYAALSPGHLIVWKVAEDAARRGFEELCFLGADDEWKRRWTTRARDHVGVVVYRPTVRGLACWALREVVKPRLPPSMRDPRTPLRHGCQQRCLIGESTVFERARGRVEHGLGLRSGLRRRLDHVLGAGVNRMAATLGEASVFAEGSTVRVIDEARLRATLDAAGRTRGLGFMPQQWETCGETFRVQKVVRRLRDDGGRMRAVHRTVLLEHVDCTGTGEPKGCGRHCPLMYRDEWVEAAPASPHAPAPRDDRPHARVRTPDEIRATLDVFGQRDGLTFMPEMEAWAGQRFPVARRIERVFELDRWVAPRAPVYVLEGLRCTGAALGGRGPCDRGCALLWHRDWLLTEP